MTALLARAWDKAQQAVFTVRYLRDRMRPDPEWTPLDDEEDVPLGRTESRP